MKNKILFFCILPPILRCGSCISYFILYFHKARSPLFSPDELASKGDNTYFTILSNQECVCFVVHNRQLKQIALFDSSIYCTGYKDTGIHICFFGFSCLPSCLLYLSVGIGVNKQRTRTPELEYVIVVFPLHLKQFHKLDGHKLVPIGQLPTSYNQSNGLRAAGTIKDELRLVVCYIGHLLVNRSVL